MAKKRKCHCPKGATMKSKRCYRKGRRGSVKKIGCKKK